MTRQNHLFILCVVCVCDNIANYNLGLLLNYLLVALGYFSLIT